MKININRIIIISFLFAIMMAPYVQVFADIRGGHYVNL